MKKQEMSDLKKNVKNGGEHRLTIRGASVPTPVAHGGSGAKSPPLAARLVAGISPQKSHEFDRRSSVKVKHSFVRELSNIVEFKFM